MPRKSTSAGSRSARPFASPLASWGADDFAGKSLGTKTAIATIKSEEQESTNWTTPLTIGVGCTEASPNEAAHDGCTPRMRGMGSQAPATTSIKTIDSEDRPRDNGLSIAACNRLVVNRNIPSATLRLVSKQVAKTAEVLVRVAEPTMAAVEKIPGATREKHTSSVKRSGDPEARGRKARTAWDGERRRVEECSPTMTSPRRRQRSSRSRSRSSPIYRRSHSGSARPSSSPRDRLEQLAMECRRAVASRVRSGGNRDRISHRRSCSVDRSTSRGEAGSRESKHLVRTTYTPDGTRRHARKRDDCRYPDGECNKSQHRQDIDHLAAKFRPNEHHNGRRRREPDTSNGRISGHGTERSPTVSQALGAYVTRSPRTRGPRKYESRVDRMATTTPITTRCATTTPRPLHPASPKSARPKAHRKHASFEDTTTAVNAIVAAMLNDFGGPSRMIFPSLMEEIAESQLAANAKQKEKSMPVLAVNDERRDGHGVRQDNRCLDHDLETNRVLELQEVESFIATSSASTGTRDINSVMISGVSVKLPRDVHRAILDLFQVTILAPYFYPPEREQASRTIMLPIYVIGPALHVPLAADLLRELHNWDPKNRLEATVHNVEYSVMDKSLIIRRPNATDDCKHSVMFYVTPEEAASLLDRRRLAWLTSECCRLTGATSIIASCEQLVSKNGESKSKVTIVGTPGQCVEASKIMRQALLQYPSVESFIQRFPRPPQLAERGLNAGISSKAGRANRMITCALWTYRGIQSTTATPRANAQHRETVNPGIDRTRPAPINHVMVTLSTGEAKSAATPGASSCRPPKSGASNFCIGICAEPSMRVTLATTTTTTDSAIITAPGQSKHAHLSRERPSAGAGADGRSAESEAAEATSAAEATAKQKTQRRALQFGQGLQNGFKPVEPVPSSEAPSTRLRHLEQWTDDGWDLPADLIEQGQVQS